MTFEAGEKVIVRSSGGSSRRYAVALVDKATAKQVFLGREVNPIGSMGVYSRRLSVEDVVPWSAELEVALTLLCRERAELERLVNEKAAQMREAFDRHVPTGASA